MKFPGQRKSRHYFPVENRDLLKKSYLSMHTLNATGAYIAGIDQILVDIEAKLDRVLLEKYGLCEGQSVIISDEVAASLHQHLKENNLVLSEFAGGTIGNTLHNYSVLSDARSVLFGVMSNDIRVGNYAYRYLCHTSSKVDLNYLHPVDGPIGCCFTFVSECGERSFALNIGAVNSLKTDAIDEDLIQGASALVISSYLMRVKDNDTIKDATLKAVRLAKEAQVPVVLSLGTKHIIADNPKWWQSFIKKYVSVIAMNEEEASALTGINNPLLAIDKALNWVDLILCTVGPQGLFMAGYTDEKYKRRTILPLKSGAIANFNEFEFSRPMLREECCNPIKVYSHISPYMGGPEKIQNTNGAGDGALSALLHDMAANSYHRQIMPDSPKHGANFLTYSSFSQVCKYANRVSFEVLVQSSSRLSRGLPEREDSLEEAYWER